MDRHLTNFMDRYGRTLNKVAKTALIIGQRLSIGVLVLLVAPFAGAVAWSQWQQWQTLPAASQFGVVFGAAVALLVFRIMLKGLFRNINGIWTQEWAKQEVSAATSHPLTPPGKFFAPPRLAEIARHEAAHVVVAHRLGYTVQRTWLHHRGGTTTYRRGEGGSTGEHLFNYAAVALAGNLSDHAAGVHHEGSDDDWAQILRVQLQIISLNDRPENHEGPLNFQSLTESLSVMVHRILDQDAELIETIARELQERAHLDKDQIRRLLNGKAAGDRRGTNLGVLR